MRLPCMPSPALSRIVECLTTIRGPLIFRPAPELWSNVLFSITVPTAPFTESSPVSSRCGAAYAVNRSPSTRSGRSPLEGHASFPAAQFDGRRAGVVRDPQAACRRVHPEATRHECGAVEDAPQRCAVAVGLLDVACRRTRRHLLLPEVALAER